MPILKAVGLSSQDIFQPRNHSTHKMAGNKIPSLLSVTMTPFEAAAAQRIEELKVEIEDYKRELLFANVATEHAEAEARVARLKQHYAEEDLALFKLNSNLEPPPPVATPTAEKEIELNRKIAALHEDKRRNAEKLGGRIQFLNNANGKLRDLLKHREEQLKCYAQLLAPIVKLAELADSCKQLEADSDSETIIGEADLIYFSIPSDPALGSEADGRGGGSVAEAGETAGLDDAMNVFTEEEMEELKSMLLTD